MSQKKQSPEMDKNQRIKKHHRSHAKDHVPKHDKRLQPSHKPAKKQHINILDAYEKYGEDCEDIFEE